MGRLGPLVLHKMASNPGRQLFGCREAPVWVIESQRHGLAFEEREQVAGDFDFTATDMVQCETFGARFLVRRAAGLTVENTTLLGQPRSPFRGGSVFGTFHCWVIPTWYAARGKKVNDPRQG